MSVVFAQWDLLWKLYCSIRPSDALLHTQELCYIFIFKSCKLFILFFSRREYICQFGSWHVAGEMHQWVSSWVEKHDILANINYLVTFFLPFSFLPLFRLSIFEAVFLSFRQCVVERTVPVQLPGVMIRGQAQGTVSLHQHVCVHLCGCVAALPARHFPKLVSTSTTTGTCSWLSGVLKRFLCC